MKYKLFLISLLTVASLCGVGKVCATSESESDSDSDSKFRPGRPAHFTWFECGPSTGPSDPSGPIHTVEVTVQTNKDGDQIITGGTIDGEDATDELKGKSLDEVPQQVVPGWNWTLDKK